MVTSLRESHAARALATCLKDFLPAGGAAAWKGHVTFGSVAAKVGVGDCWPADPGSKTPRIALLLEATLDRHRQLFEPLIMAIVREGLLYRKKQSIPITPEEIDRINGHILEIGFRFPDLWDHGFKDSLSVDDDTRAKKNVAQVRRDDEVRTTERQRQQVALLGLRDRFLALYAMTDRQAAGLALEVLLNDLFRLGGLAPRLPFRVTGEQIDGSVELDHEVYILEAKWEKRALSEQELLVFRGKIEGKSAFTRGIFIALNGVTGQALEAITRGKQATFFIINGHDLMMILEGQMSVVDFLQRRRRLFVEEGLVVVPFDRLANGS